MHPLRAQVGSHPAPKLNLNLGTGRISTWTQEGSQLGTYGAGHQILQPDPDPDPGELSGFKGLMLSL